MEVERWKSYLHTAKACSLRGGASLLQMENGIFIFGGADRDQQHFYDLTICHNTFTNNDALVWETCTTTGDIPTARSGHAVCSIGKYMFLYGGIDFTEEVVYNDLYVLNTETLVWQYVGEKGEEITGRNSHSLHILSFPSSSCNSINSSSNDSASSANEVNKATTSGSGGVADTSTAATTANNNNSMMINCLVLYGGASPEHGPSNDIYYSMLPSSSSCIDDIGNTEFFVTWMKVGSNNSQNQQQQPCAREMHSSCTYKNTMIICGGRDENGQILSDTWFLEGKCNRSNSSNNNIDSSTHNTNPNTIINESNNISLQWRQVPILDLPIGRCSHSMALSSLQQSFNSNTHSLCIFGGFTADSKISNELIIHPYFSSDTETYNTLQPISSSDNSTSDNGINTWQSVKFSSQNSSNNSGSDIIQERFGSCMCAAPDWYISKTIQNHDPSTISAGLIVKAGGEDEESDKNSHSNNKNNNNNGVILFGGVNVQCDLADVWLLLTCSVN